MVTVLPRILCKLAGLPGDPTAPAAPGDPAAPGSPVEAKKQNFLPTAVMNSNETMQRRGQTMKDPYKRHIH